MKDTQSQLQSFWAISGELVSFSQSLNPTLQFFLNAMHLRTVTATIIHTESGRREEMSVTLFLEDHHRRFTLIKVFVKEFGQQLLFDKETNEILIPD